jgi:hypothetical protein
MLLAVGLALADAGGSLALAAPALTLALFAESHADDRPFLPLAAALLLWTMPVLAALVAAASWPVASFLLAAILLVALLREAGWKPGRAGHDVAVYPVKAEREGAP